jgi:hypothetical protein
MASQALDRPPKQCDRLHALVLRVLQMDAASPKPTPDHRMRRSAPGRMGQLTCQTQLTVSRES